eukprot:GFYU01002775.1.p1 GENE.GFYU01002775.1~~GFYU01002775.1.p1  ORF type:complete len:518 (+),score=28.85 GFYU01002775.1:54-1556(+)
MALLRLLRGCMTLYTVFVLLLALPRDTHAFVEAQCDTLRELYNATDGPNWGEYRTVKGWDDVDNHDCCTWTGVSCTWHGVTTDTVKMLNLENMNMKGTIPESLSTITSLTRLNLGYNQQLSGTIPASLKYVKDLVLPETQVSGTIPTSLTSLEFLRLERNPGMSGDILHSLHAFPALTYIYISQQLWGTIPTSLGALTSLRVLDLSYNQLTGGIPDWLGQLKSLKVLELQGNQLSGTLPDSLGQLTDMSTLDLRYNHLSGSIPASIENLKNIPDIVFRHLKKFPLSNNNFDCPPPDWAVRRLLVRDVYDCGQVTGVSFLPLGTSLNVTVATGVIQHRAIPPTSRDVTNLALSGQGDDECVIAINSDKVSDSVSTNTNAFLFNSTAKPYMFMNLPSNKIWYLSVHGPPTSGVCTATIHATVHCGDCNGGTCDVSSGHCKDCPSFTGGAQCEFIAERLPVSGIIGVSVGCFLFGVLVMAIFNYYQELRQKKDDGLIQSLIQR